ncbi:hypothetical protein H8E77_20205 [bacterium]|nr:hypothetical protein [bacterium]
MAKVILVTSNEKGRDISSFLPFFISAKNNARLRLSAKLTNYQVAVYAIDWDSSVRVEELVGFQGNKAPDEADVTVENPDFHEGVYYLWVVNGNDPFKLQITHKGGANWVISGIFVDDLKGAAAHPKSKLAITWGEVKQ